jgi:hypothetical protein
VLFPVPCERGCMYSDLKNLKGMRSRSQAGGLRAGTGAIQWPFGCVSGAPSRNVGTTRSDRPNIRIFATIRWSGNSSGLADGRSHACLYRPNAVELLAAL